MPPLSGSSTVRRNLKSKNSFPVDDSIGVNNSAPTSSMILNDIEAAPAFHHRNLHKDSYSKSNGAPNNNGHISIRNGTNLRRRKTSKGDEFPRNVPIVWVLSLFLMGVIFLAVGSNTILYRSSAVVGATGDHPSGEKLKAHDDKANRRTTERHGHRDSNTHHRRDHEHKDSKHQHGGKEEKQMNRAIGHSSSEVHRRNERNSPKQPKSGGHHNPRKRNSEYQKQITKSILPSVISANSAAALDVAEFYDVIIAGAGPSGLTAALFAARAGLKVYVLGSPTTGLLSQTKLLDNFPSFGDAASAKSGPQWLESTLAQASSWGAVLGPPGLLATQLAWESFPSDGTSFFTISTKESTLHAWSVIVASGSTPRTLGLPHEEKLWGNSLHSCAICDGHLYQATKNSTRVLVVGGGDAAVDAALLLARYATEVVVVHRRDEFSKVKNGAGLHRLSETPNIRVLKPWIVKEWIVDNQDPSRLVGALLQANNSTSETMRLDSIDGAFVTIGATPNTNWIKDSHVALDEEGLILTAADLSSTTPGTEGMLTASSIPGLFAAGEVTDKHYKQAITAAAAGAQAAIDSERWLREQTGITSQRNFQQATDAKHETIEDTDTKDSGVEQVANGDDNKLENCDMTSEDCIQSIVQKYPVVVFSKPWCPYCRKALEALSRAGVGTNSDRLLVIDLSKHDNTQAIQSTLQKMTGRRTVPNVFVGAKSIGGGDETYAAEQGGKLIPLLMEAGALEQNENDAKPPVIQPANGDQTEKIQDWKKARAQIPPLPKSKKLTPQEKKRFTRHSSTDTEPCDLSERSCFKELVEKYPILLISLSWCPHCKRILELLDRIGVPLDKIHIIDLDDYKEIEPLIREHMKVLTKQRGVPNLFVGGQHVGGFVETDQLHSEGLLVPMFQQVGAISSAVS